MHILLVDDEAVVLETVGPFLVRCGHEVTSAFSVAEAKAAIGNRWEDLDLVITDVCMPGRDGTQLLRLVRERFPDIDVVLMTGHPLIRDTREAIELGATGFLRKPVRLTDLRQLVDALAATRQERAHRRVESLNQGCAASLRDAMTLERLYARRLHGRLLPRDLPELAGLDVAIRHLPSAGQVSDVIEVRPYGPGRTLLVVADVSGDSVPSVFGGIALKAWFAGLSPGLAPVEMLARAESAMRGLFADEFHATAFCACYDAMSRTLTYASAGHPPALVCGADGPLTLNAMGAPLGCIGDPRREAGTYVLADDEILVVYTDGLTGDLVSHAAVSDHGGCHRRDDADLHGILTDLLDQVIRAQPLRAYAEDMSLVALRARRPVLAGAPLPIAGPPAVPDVRDS